MTCYIARFAAIAASALAALMLGTAPSANAQTTSFTNIASSGGTLRLNGIGNGGFSINNSGTVAFRAAPQFSPTPYTRVYTGDGGDLTDVIAPFASSFTNSTDHFGTAISDNGTVAFIQNRTAANGGFSLNVVSGGTLRRLESPVIQRMNNPTINANGRVATADFADGTGIQRVLTTDGLSLNTVVRSGTGDFSVLGSGSEVSINDSGAVAFLGRKLGANAGNGVFTSDGTTVTTIASVNGSSFTSFSTPQMNASGSVLFYGNTTATSTTGLYVGNGGALTLIAGGDSGGTLSSGAAFNDRGNIAYTLSSPTTPGGKGILLALTGVAPRYRVIGVGDSLFGSIVTDVNMSQFAMNDRDQIAFQYTLQDGRFGLAVANVATVVPEANTLPLMAITIPIAFAYVARGRKRRRAGIFSLTNE